MTNEEKAKEKYPVEMMPDYSGAGDNTYDINAQRREGYIEGLNDNTKAIEVLEKLKENVESDINITCHIVGDHSLSANNVYMEVIKKIEQEMQKLCEKPKTVEPEKQ